MEVVLVAWWLLALAALGALGYPLAARLFPRYPAAGAGFAPTVALATLATVAYWTGQVTFGRHTLWLGLVVLGGLAAAAALDRDALREGEVAVAADLPFARRPVAEAAAVFVAAYLLLVAVRAADPAVTAGGGEKFLDFSLLRSLLRAGSLPPADPWFAGETVNYYYGGHLVAALLTMLAGVAPAFGYNLALASFYAMLATGAFTLAGAVAAHNGVDRRRAGLAAAFLVAVGSNLVTAGRLAVGLLPGSLRVAVAERVAAASDYGAEELLAGAEGFHYWTASRVIPGTINEFPLFAWLNGDLHAHMMATPFLLLAAGVAFAYWRTPAADLRRRRALVFGVLPLLGSLQVVVHTWDFPTVFGVAWLALALAPAHPLPLLPGGDRLAAALGGADAGRAAAELRRTGGALAVAGVAGGLAALLGAPFLLGAGSGQEVALLDPADRSGLGALLLVHGAFVLAFGAYLVGRVGRERLAPVVAGVAAVGAAATLAGFAALALVVPLLALGWLAVRFDRGGFETALIVGGAGLVGLVELVFVAEQAGPGRMNTVFKTYFQVWVLWGVAAGVVLADLWERPWTGIATPLTRRTTARAAAADGGATGDDRPGLAASLPDWIGVPSPGTRRAAARGFVALLLLSVAPYGALAMDQHFERHDVGSLHATAFADDRHPEEAAAIRWLDANADGDDVLLEAPGTGASPEGLAADPSHPGMYSWHSNPASSLTGIPTVAGWAHEVGYRGPEPYYGRVAGVDRAYAGSDAERAAVLREHDVTYVWVGPTERQRYGDVEFGRLDGVELVYETGAVRIYRVEQDELPA